MIQRAFTGTNSNAMKIQDSSRTHKGSSAPDPPEPANSYIWRDCRETTHFRATIQAAPLRILAADAAAAQDDRTGLESGAQVVGELGQPVEDQGLSGRAAIRARSLRVQGIRLHGAA
jgi:hypothetical protein